MEIGWGIRMEKKRCEMTGKEYTKNETKWKDGHLYYKTSLFLLIPIQDSPTARGGVDEPLEKRTKKRGDRRGARKTEETPPATVGPETRSTTKKVHTDRGRQKEVASMRTGDPSPGRGRSQSTDDDNEGKKTGTARKSIRVK